MIYMIYFSKRSLWLLGGLQEDKSKRRQTSWKAVKFE